ncbi:MAG: RHS repeat protein [Sedimentisphaerales bacterium]|nr:RHS repeat protein [Sedimentisphaerales bacterium]
MPLDAFGWLKKITYPDGDMTFSYDGFGRRASVCDKRNDDDRIGGTAARRTQIHR